MLFILNFLQSLEHRAKYTDELFLEALRKYEFEVREVNGNGTVTTYTNNIIKVPQNEHDPKYSDANIDIYVITKKQKL